MTTRNDTDRKVWAPYAPPATVLQVIEHFSNTDVPPEIDKARLTQIGVSDSVLPRVWSTLEFLGLITEDGTALETFRNLRYASEEEYQEVFQGLLRSAYAQIFSAFNPEDLDERAMDNAFKPYSPGGQRSRMVILFVGLCQKAGFNMKVQLKERNTEMKTGAGRNKTPNPKQQQTPPAPQQSETGVSSGSLLVSERDLAELGSEDFEEVWAALGKVYRARGLRQKADDRQSKEMQLAMSAANNGGSN